MPRRPCRWRRRPDRARATPAPREARADRLAELAMPCAHHGGRERVARVVENRRERELVVDGAGDSGGLGALLACLYAARRSAMHTSHIEPMHWWNRVVSAGAMRVSVSITPPPHGRTSSSPRATGTRSRCSASPRDRRCSQRGARAPTRRDAPAPPRGDAPSRCSRPSRCHPRAAGGAVVAHHEAERLPHEGGGARVDRAAAAAAERTRGGGSGLEPGQRSGGRCPRRGRGGGECVRGSTRGAPSAAAAKGAARRIRMYQPIRV